MPCFVRRGYSLPVQPLFFQPLKMQLPPRTCITARPNSVKSSPVHLPISRPSSAPRTTFSFSPPPGVAPWRPRSPTSLLPAVSVGPIALGDFNHSGHHGLAVGEFNNEAAVILLGNGKGSFVPSSAAFANAFGLPINALDAA